MSVIIAIAGGSCSGKTTLARHLQRRLGTDEAMLIRQDDYYFDIRERAALGVKDGGEGMPNFDVPVRHSSLSRKTLHDCRRPALVK